MLITLLVYYYIDYLINLSSLDPQIFCRVFKSLMSIDYWNNTHFLKQKWITKSPMLTPNSFILLFFSLLILKLSTRWSVWESVGGSRSNHFFSISWKPVKWLSFLRKHLLNTSVLISLHNLQWSSHLIYYYILWNDCNYFRVYKLAL